MVRIPRIGIRRRCRWDDAALDSFLADPQKTVAGNLMPYSGLQSAADRVALIAYLKTLGTGSP